MPASQNTVPSSVTSRGTLGGAAAGGVAVMGLIPLTAVVGEWWLLGVTFTALSATAALIVIGLFGLLAQTGEPLTDARTAKRRVPAGAPRRRARVPVLRSA